MGVPVSVNKPPVAAANDNGINIFDAGVFKRQAAAIITGINDATVPVLLIKADKMAEPIIIRTNNLLELLLEK